MTLTLLAYHSDPTAIVEPSQDRGRVSRLGIQPQESDSPASRVNLILGDTDKFVKASLHGAFTNLSRF
jgi:hypothetical protein